MNKPRLQTAMHWQATPRALVLAVATSLLLLPTLGSAKSHARKAPASRPGSKQYLAPPAAKQMPGKASLNANDAVSKTRTRKRQSVPKPQPIQGVDFNDSATARDTVALTGAGMVRIATPSRQPKEIRRQRFGGLKGRRLSLTSIESTGSVQSVTARRSVELVRIQRNVANPNSKKVINSKDVQQGSMNPGDPQ